MSRLPDQTLRATNTETYTNMTKISGTSITGSNTSATKKFIEDRLIDFFCPHLTKKGKQDLRYNTGSQNVRKCYNIDI